jgi:hypothetical protein
MHGDDGCPLGQSHWLSGDSHHVPVEAQDQFKLAVEFKSHWHIGELGWWLVAVPSPLLHGAALARRSRGATRSRRLTATSMGILEEHLRPP